MTSSTTSTTATTIPVNTLPPAITGAPTAIDVTNISATIAWETNRPASSIVEYGLSQNNLNLIVESPAPIPTHRVNLQGLLPGTQYFFRVGSASTGVGVTNGTGKFTHVPGTFSSIESFRTLAFADTSSPVITEPATVFNIGTTSVDIRWTTDRSSHSLVRYGISASTLTQVTSRPELVTTHQITLQGLIPGTVYFFEVESTDAAARTVRSPATPFTTALATRAPLFLFQPTIVSVTSSTATISWLTDQPGTTEVQFGLTPALGDKQTGVPDVSEHTVTLVGLSPATNYHFRAITTNANGGTLSPISVFGTLGAGAVVAPPSITAIPAAEQITTNSAVIKWQTDQASNSIVRYGKTVALDQVQSISENVTAHQVPLTNLDANQSYFFTVSASNTGGTEIVSPVSSFRTLAAGQTAEPLVFLSAPQILANTDTAATITWQTNQSSNTVVTYGAGVGALNQTSAIPEAVTLHTATLSGLTPDTQYFYRATSVTALGGLVISPEGTFRTRAAADTGGLRITNAPSITSIDVRSATISFITDRPGNTVIRYGTSPALLDIVQTKAESTTLHEITITGLLASTQYFFSASATDSLGSTATSATIAFATPAVNIGIFIVGFPTVTSTTSESATIIWSTNTAGNSEVNYGETNALGTKKTVSETVVTHTVVLTGLKASTRYFFSVTSTGSLTNPVTSPITEFTTPAANATAAPLTFTATPTAVDILADSATIKWATNKAASGIVEYGTSALVPDNVKSTGVNGLSHNVTLTGLLPNTQYFAKLSSVTAIPPATITSNLSFRTSSGGTIDRILVSPPLLIEITPTRCTVVWTTNRNSNGVVEYGKTTAFGSAVSSAALSATSHAVALTGLDSLTKYFVRVTSADVLGLSSATSETIFFTTPVQAPLLPPIITEIPTASAITTTSATIQWRTNLFGNSVVKWTAGTQGQTVSAAENVMEHRVLLAGLSPGTRYDFTVATTTPLGESVTSGTLSFTTSSSLTSSIAIIAVPTVIEQSGTEASIVWTTDNLGNSLVEYGVSGAGTAVRSTADSVRAHRIRLSGLSPNTRYSFRVSSTTPDGSATANSPFQEFLTPPVLVAIPPRITSPPAMTFTTSTSATIEWKTDVPTIGYVHYGRGLVELGVSVADPDTASSHKVIVTGLTPSTQYFFQTVSSSPGGGVTTATQNFTTQAGAAAVPPVIISGPIIDGASDRILVVRWRTDQPGNSIVSFGTTQAVDTTSDPNASTDHVLTLTSLLPNTEYSIRASTTAANGLTVTSSTITARTLQAPDVTPPVITEGPIVRQKDHSSATIFWRTDENANSVVNFGVSGLERVASDPASGAEHSVTLSGLASSTNYQYRVSSTDARGNGPAPSAVLFFATDSVPDVTAPVILTGPNVVYTSDTTAVVAWTTDEASNSEVRFGTTAVLTSSKFDSSLITQHSVQLTNLAVNTSYFIRVFSTDVAGNRAASAAPSSSSRSFVFLSGGVVHVDAPVTSFRTGAGRDTTAPGLASIRAAYVGEDSALIEWDTNEVSTSAIVYGKSESALNSRVGNLERVSQHQLRLVRLEAGVRYSYKIESTDPSGNTSTSAVLTFTTAAARDSVAPTITAGPTVVVTQTTATITWTTNESSDSRVRFSLGSQLNLDRADTTPTTAHSIALTNLLPGTTYNYRVASTDISGNGPAQSGTLQFTTSGIGSGFANTLHFAQFAFGDGTTSFLTLTNPSRSVVARGTLRFRKSAGTALTLKLNGVDIVGEVDFALAPNGTVNLVTSSDGQLQAGSVLIESNIPIAGTVVFDLPGLGIAGVGESRPARSFIAPIERSAGGSVNTGVAITNTSSGAGAAAARVTLTLRDRNGVQVGQPTTVDLAINGQVAQFVDQLFSTQNLNLEGFVGTLVGESNVDIAATALRLALGSQNSVATLPVADANTSATDLIFAQFAFGGGLFSQLTFVNPSKTLVASGTLRFYRSTDGTPLPAVINGNQTTGEIPVNVGPQGIQIFTTPTDGANITVGWARLQSNNPLGGSILFSLAAIGTEGVGISKAQKEFIAPMERNSATNVNTGIAVANLENKKANIKITLKDEVGLTITSKTIQLVELGQTAKFIHELFPEINTDNFRGVMLVESDTLVGGTVLRIVPGETAVLPVGSIVP